MLSYQAIKKYICRFLFFTLPVSASLQAQEPGIDTAIHDMEKEIIEGMDIVADYSYEQKDHLLASIKRRVTVFDSGINAVEQRAESEWAGLSKESLKARRKALQNLHMQRNIVSEWYGAIKYSSRDAWEEVKSGFTSAYQALGKAYMDTRDQLTH